MYKRQHVHSLPLTAAVDRNKCKDKFLRVPVMLYLVRITIIVVGINERPERLFFVSAQQSIKRVMSGTPYPYDQFWGHASIKSLVVGIREEELRLPPLIAACGLHSDGNC